MNAAGLMANFYRKLPQFFSLCVAAFASLATLNANGQSWNYRINAAGEPGGGVYRQANDPLGNGYVTLEEKDGKAIFRMAGINLIKCYQGELDALVTRTAETTIITVPPKLSGCGEVRFVIKNDGTGGKRENKRGDAWVWDKYDRDLTPRK